MVNISQVNIGNSSKIVKATSGGFFYIKKYTSTSAITTTTIKLSNSYIYGFTVSSKGGGFYIDQDIVTMSIY